MKQNKKKHHRATYKKKMKPKIKFPFSTLVSHGIISRIARSLPAAYGKVSFAVQECLSVCMFVPLVHWCPLLRFRYSPMHPFFYCRNVSSSAGCSCTSPSLSIASILVSLASLGCSVFLCSLSHHHSLAHSFYFFYTYSHTHTHTGCGYR